jgi:DNA (cytosine-5)-methyltransferase 1
VHAERRSLRKPREDGRDRPDGGRKEACGHVGARGSIHGVGNARGPGLAVERSEPRASRETCPGDAREASQRAGSPTRRLADADGRIGGNGHVQRGGQYGFFAAHGYARDLDGGRWAGPTNGFWRDADWLFCTDGKWRPSRPGAQPLVDASPARLVRLRGYGNAINAEVARRFIEAYIDVKEPA